jgi:hypothetical protein
MPRFKTKYNVFENNDELYSEAIAKENGIYIPETWDWENNSQIAVEDVIIWECLFEQSGLSGIYAAWAPYEEFYIVTDRRVVVKEFFGASAKELVDEYCVAKGIPAPVRYNKRKIKSLEGMAS